MIQGSILEPKEIKTTDGAKLEQLLRVPDGFEVKVFVRDLINPRMLAVSDGRIILRSTGL